MTESEVEELLKGEFDLDVVNFKKYNPGDTSKWWRAQNDWFLDPKFVDMPDSTQLVWFKLCTLRATKGTVLCGYTTRALQLRVGCKRRAVRVDLLTLWKKGLISLHTDRQTDIQTPSGEQVALSESNSLKSRPKFDFDLVYQLYPRKKGKAGGLKALKKKIKTQEEYEAVLVGVKNFAAVCARDKVDAQYIPYFSTWVNDKRWEDDHADPKTRAVIRLEDLHED